MNSGTFLLFVHESSDGWDQIIYIRDIYCTRLDFLVGSIIVTSVNCTSWMELGLRGIYLGAYKCYKSKIRSL